jgi:hypothetical protein
MNTIHVLLGALCQFAHDSRPLRYFEIRPAQRLSQRAIIVQSAGIGETLKSGEIIP